MILFGSSDFFQTSHIILGSPKKRCVLLINSFSVCMAEAFFLCVCYEISVLLL